MGKYINNVKVLVYTAVFTALVAVCTAVIQIPRPNGYIHLGDSMIYLASCILPFPFGAISGSFGALIADSILAPIWMIPSFIIKFLNSMTFYMLKTRGNKIITIRSSIAVLLSSIITVVGYYLASVILFGGFKTQLAFIPGNIIQAVGSAIVFIIVGIAFDKSSLHKRIHI